MNLYEAVARSTDPWTSWEPARSVTGTRRLQAEVLYVLRNRGPLSDEAILHHVTETFGPQHTPSGVRTRRSELVAKGLARSSGQTGRTATGRRTILWEAVNQPEQGSLFG